MSNASFLPEDYLARQSERRTNVISLVLFVVVMLGIFLAFLFTNQKWTQVKQAQENINVRYQKAATDIHELTELEELKEEMLEKAELAAALVETVPRSILLAELINRMPDRLSLLEFDLLSERLKPQVTRQTPAGATGRLGPARAQTKEQASVETKKRVVAPKYQVSISLVGAAPTDLEVSKFLAELNAYALLEGVTLEYSEEKEIEGQTMREFKIEMELNPDADVRNVTPRILSRQVRDPMNTSGGLNGVPAPAATAVVGEPDGSQGD